MNSRTAPLSFSVLKPLKGCDSETEACLESWLAQDYAGETEFLFGVADASDPVCNIVQRLIAKYPNRRARLVICEPILGPNAKVSSLCHMARQARLQIILVSDDDVFVPPFFLKNLSAQFSAPGVSLVNSFYILPANNLPMAFEALAVNADFWTQVLQGTNLKPMDFALGAVMAVRRESLEAIGGFETLLDYLADDYQLGNKVARAGGRVVLAPTPVHCRAAAQTDMQVWKHQLRWARTIRVCQPIPYFFSILSNATLFPLLAAATGWIGRVLLAAALVIRCSTAVINYSRLVNRPTLWPALLAPVKDLLAAVIWAASFLGSTITWRGQKFRVNKGGKLTPLA